MTKREFDKATKWNAGSKLASDERCSYRERRCREHDGSGVHFSNAAPSDYIACRARALDRLRRQRYPHEPFLALFGPTPFRAAQRYAMKLGKPMLGPKRRWANV